METIPSEKNSDPKKEDPHSDAIQSAMGSFGRYQLYVFFIMSWMKYGIVCHQMAILFLAPKVSFLCSDTGNATCPCETPVYDTSVFTWTMIMEWDLICSRQWMVSLSQMLFQLGVLVGSVAFGMASDRFGRKYPLLVAVALQASAGVASAFMANYWLFNLMRFTLGATVGGLLIVGFVIVMEFVGTKHREIVTALYHANYNFGFTLVALFGYFFRDFHDYQLAVSVPTILLLSYAFLSPETPRWLVARNKVDEAVKLLERVARVNKRPTHNIKSSIVTYQTELKSKSSERRGTLLDLFSTPNIRKNILAMSFNWLVCSYCFYGISQYVGQLDGNMFINVTANGALTLFGSVISIPMMKFFGRRAVVASMHFVCGACLIGMVFIPSGPVAVTLACVGVTTSMISFSTVYLYCSELFPTVVRNAALGFSSMTSRLGSMIAPFVIDLQVFGSWVPPVVFAGPPIVAGFATLLMPETKGRELMTTIEEAENFNFRTNKENKVNVACYTLVTLRFLVKLGNLF